MDLMIARENEEDCDAGIEYQITPGAMECLKLITAEPTTSGTSKHGFVEGEPSRDAWRRGGAPDWARAI